VRGIPPRIALIGFMGSGKSTVGRLLAKRLGYRFQDLDDLIEEKAGKTIREIFSAEGEAGFRDLESEALGSLAGASGLVLACGGGAAVQERNAACFRESFFCVYLEVSFEEFLRRAGGDPARPLLDKPLKQIRELYDSRLPAYRALGSVGQTISTDGRSPLEVAEDVLSRLVAAT
jgi:shikimate kinase